MIPLSKYSTHFFVFVLICSLWVGIFFILPEFIDNPGNGFWGFLIIGGQWSLICLASGAIIYFSAINKYFFAVFFPIYSLFGSILAFYRYAFKATLTPMLVDATLHNDIRTSLDVISPTLIVFVLISLAISIGFVWFRFKKITIKRCPLHFAISLLLLFVILGSNARVRNSIMQRFPFSVYYNLAEYEKLQVEIATIRINPDSTICYKCNDSLTVVFVIGEALRADHLSLNGYKRLTNPRLSVRKNVVSFPRVFSEYTNTNRSLPHILTRADSVNTQRAFTETSFIPIFKSCGYKTAWITNQDAANTYVEFMKECDTIMYCHPEKSVYNYNMWLDEDILPLAKMTLDKKAPNNLLILHTIGSHWYYNNHFSKPFEVFKPTTSSRIITQCSRAEIINSYDNTVVYTDYFLDKLIQQLEGKKAILIYLSDHGETLGEDGLWLHAGDDIASKNPACIIWCSDRFIAAYPEKADAIRMNRNQFIRTDFLFHSILNAGNIPTKIIDNKLNVFYKP
jgi:glucan phosphoethanolaminetransferase (alkaline phosphatase superfamily)